MGDIGYGIAILLYVNSSSWGPKLTWTKWETFYLIFIVKTAIEMQLYSVSIIIGIYARWTLNTNQSMGYKYLNFDK